MGLGLKRAPAGSDRSAASRRRRMFVGAAVGAELLSVGGWGAYRAIVAMMPEPRHAVVYGPDPEEEAERERRRAVLDQIPAAGVRTPGAAEANGASAAAGAQGGAGRTLGPVRFGPSLGGGGKGLGPVAITVPGGGAAVSGPVAIAPSALTVGGHGEADPVAFALHPSRFADPTHMVAKIGLAAVEASGPKEAEGKTVTPYEKACALEKSRAFVMSMCQDLQGRIWVGCEAGAPGDGVTGGVQVWDPSKPPLEAFTEYTTKDGLGDNNEYAVACDLQGRIWVGHLNHGVSVWNGERWQGYEVVGGLNRPDTLSGPLGERVFHITVCPKLEVEATFKDALTGRESAMSGSVWMCTSAGLSIYFPSTDTWSYVTRTEGLPSDQANSLAFGKDGSVYVATQCDGVAIGNPSDGYKVWKQVKGPEELPVVANGEGLPTNLINDVLVAKDGTVYVATTAGVASSKDRGDAWKFVRGRDWIAKVKGRIDGPPEKWTAIEDFTLAEDYVTCLGEDKKGEIYLGYRTRGYEIASLAFDSASSGSNEEFVNTILSDGIVIQGTYGSGLASSSTQHIVRDQMKLEIFGAVSFPAGARSFNLGHRFETFKGEFSPSGILLLSSDWATQGNWLGRYGRYWMVFAACAAPYDLCWGLGASNVQYEVKLGEGGPKGDTLRYWVSQNHTADIRSLELPLPYLESRVAKGLTLKSINRRQAEWDDHGEALAPEQEGPGILCSLTVPKGYFFLSFYNVNENGQRGHNRYRDFLCSVREQPIDLPLNDFRKFRKWPEIAKARVRNTFGGEYTRFLVKGPRRLAIQFGRNYSLNTNLNGIFLDEVFNYSVHDQMASEPTIGVNGEMSADEEILPEKLDTDFERRAILKSRIDYFSTLHDSIALDQYASIRNYSWAHIFEAAERKQHSLGLATPRDIEFSLPWLGNADTYPAENRDLVRMFQNAIEKKGE